MGEGGNCGLVLLAGLGHRGGVLASQPAEDAEECERVLARYAEGEDAGERERAGLEGASLPWGLTLLWIGAMPRSLYLCKTNHRATAYG